MICFDRVFIISKLLQINLLLNFVTNTCFVYLVHLRVIGNSYYVNLVLIICFLWLRPYEQFCFMKITGQSFLRDYFTALTMTSLHI